MQKGSHQVNETRKKGGRGQAHMHKQELCCENSREPVISLFDAASYKRTWGMRSQQPRVESLGRSGVTSHREGRVTKGQQGHPWGQL